MWLQWGEYIYEQKTRGEGIGGAEARCLTVISGRKDLEGGIGRRTK